MSKSTFEVLHRCINKNSKSLIKTGEFYDDWKSEMLRPLQKIKGIDTSNVNGRLLVIYPFY